MDEKVLRGTYRILARKKKEKSYYGREKEQMSEDVIYSTLDDAVKTNSMVLIQIEEINTNGNYSEDILGWIEGYEGNNLYVSGNRIELDSIRNIQLYDQIKWSERK
ncbi:hypothetical protein ACOJIU_18065 (plasmid) [Carnobacterium maltaromaticum]|uniref:hypothetical protein n=1 Tax=Carnobacterium maltaromaticum TaxID=2751 RepID=UPI003B985565